MKKVILLIAAVIMSATFVNAQSLIRYQGEINAGYSIGVGDYAFDRANLHLLNGVRVGQYFSTGIGVGVDYFHADDNLFVPVYLNLKGYLPVTEVVSPFLSFDIGASIGVTSDVKKASGLLCVPALGCSFKTTHKSAFLVSVGYTVQKVSKSGYKGFNANAVTIKLGYQF
ncbi:hypothetical protein [uncultured Alistipes sp.]|jgi:hypothetical protein|uniref:hypothetical protein n=1 Tax=uncultured Alistipes sp. TaxID=538949 RepID=UPI0025E80F9B|nr:hypothetical protein [uncultured Alistipes sp.]